MTETTITPSIPAMELGTYVVFSQEAADALYRGKIGKITDKSSDGRIYVEVLNQQFDAGRSFGLFVSPSIVTVHSDQENAGNFMQLQAWESRYHWQRKIILERDSAIDALMDEIVDVVDNAGYCQEYERVVDEVNSAMARQGHNIALKKREQEWEVEVEVRGYVSTRYTVSVTATDEDAARELLTDDPESYFDPSDALQDQINYYGFDEVTVE